MVRPHAASVSASRAVVSVGAGAARADGRPEAAMSREVRHIGDRGFSVKGTGESSDRREREVLPTGSALTALYLAQFGWMDVWRRAQGDAGAACGLGPDECPYRIVATGSHWRLRAYSDRPAMAPLLVVAAPIKRPYIWDLAPSVSAVRHCLRQGLDVHL